MRYYVTHSHPDNGKAVLRDAFTHGEVGAREVVRLALLMRGNRRTRRTLDSMREQYRRRQPAKWFLDYRTRIYALWKVLRKLALPNAPLTGGGLRVSQLLQRELVRYGVVHRDRRTLRETATQASTDLLRTTQDKQLILWLDNLYWQRYGTTPGEENLSQNVSAMAVLVLDDVSTLQVATRSVRFPTFPGHLGVTDVVNRMNEVVSQLRTADTQLRAAVVSLNALRIERHQLRVPLDLQRPQRQRMQWRPWNLAQQQVSSNPDLLSLLLDVCDVQKHSRHVLPLLVDENIHYRILRLMYSSSLRRWDVAHVLRKVPVVFGVWHAYKHTLLVVHRAFFPVLAQLENTGALVAGGRVCAKRRVLFLEKLFAVLVLLRDDLEGPVMAELTVAEQDTRDHEQLRRDDDESLAITSRLRVRLGILRALHQLLTFWAPALLRLGYLVRQCTWEGRPGGPVTGRTAHQLLCQCLLLQAHLLEDWDAKAEYTRTMAVALLTWHPWLMDRPGCMFVEESGEALLSRFMASVRHNHHLWGFDSAWRLFITLNASSREAPATRGGVRQDLLVLMGERLRGLIASDGELPYPEITSPGTGNGHWLARFPPTYSFPESFPSTGLRGDQLLRLLQSALSTLCTGPLQQRTMQDWLDDHVSLASIVDEAHRDRAHRTIATWATQRAERLRDCSCHHATSRCEAATQSSTSG